MDEINSRSSNVKRSRRNQSTGDVQITGDKIAEIGDGLA